MRAAVPPILALALALPAPAEGAANAAATLLPGDRLHGSIGTPGDADTLGIFVPEGSMVSADLLPEAGSAILPALELRDGADAPVDLAPYSEPGPGGAGVRVRDALAGPGGGIFSFVVTASGGTSGKYAFRMTAKMPKKTFGTLTLGAGEQGEFSAEAPAGSKLSFSVKPPAGAAAEGFHVYGLRGPDKGVTPLDGLKGRRIPLDRDGAWTLLVENTGPAAATLDVTMDLALPRPSRRVLYLSPAGFGPAPRVKSVNPRKVLDDRPAEGIAVSGEGFDPAATVRLEKKDQAPLLPTSLTFLDGNSFTADFDVKDADPGAWTLVVENPSGGAGRGKLTVQAAGSVQLPEGVRPLTEVWWLDFDRNAFPDDLAAMGLGSSHPTAAALAEAAVKSYTVYYLRRAFGLEPVRGKVGEGGANVSFCVSAPPYTVGGPGTTFNRLRIGGAAEPGDPSSNPYYPWGDGPLDAGNATFDDVGPDGGQGRGVRTASLAPSSGGSVAGYYNALKPLLDLPLTGADVQYFLTDFNPGSAAEGARYREITVAVSGAAREIAGTVAHFVARAMGVADGSSGLMKVPAMPGEYATLGTFGFLPAEFDQVAAAARDDPGLPGRVRTLRANYFPHRESVGYLLPNLLTGQAYAQPFLVAGGRPDRAEGDLQFTGAGTLPPGLNFLATGGLSGTVPLRYPDTTLVGGVFRFLVKMKDRKTGQVLFFAHRLNVLVDLTNPSLSAAEIALGSLKNTQTVNTP